MEYLVGREYSRWEREGVKGGRGVLTRERIARRKGVERPRGRGRKLGEREAQKGGGSREASTRGSLHKGKWRKGVWEGFLRREGG